MLALEKVSRKRKSNSNAAQATKRPSRKEMYEDEIDKMYELEIGICVANLTD